MVQKPIGYEERCIEKVMRDVEGIWMSEDPQYEEVLEEVYDPEMEMRIGKGRLKPRIGLSGYERFAKMMKDNMDIDFRPGEVRYMGEENFDGKKRGITQANWQLEASFEIVGREFDFLLTGEGTHRWTFEDDPKSVYNEIEIGLEI